VYCGRVNEGIGMSFDVYEAIINNNKLLEKKKISKMPFP
jgi:hypothetical protein